MSNTGKIYDEEFRKRAVEMIYTTGKTLAQLARELGCSTTSLKGWKIKYGRPPELDNDDLKQKDLQALHHEIKLLKKELSIVTEQREILKKAAAILGR